jgi:hypothetical protein
MEDGETISCYFYGMHKTELEVLMKLGTYHSKSDLLRHLVEKEYAERMKNSKEELQIKKRELQEQVNMLESIGMVDETGVDEIVAQYILRRSKVVVSSKGDYEIKSKKYIEGNLSKMKKAFPGMTVDEIYKKLESECEAHGKR